MMSRPSLYIDFGSCQTRIFSGENAVFVEPSCLVLNDGQPQFIGQKAYELLGKVPAPLQHVFPVELGRVTNQAQAKLFLMAIDRQYLPQVWWRSWLGGSGYVLTQANVGAVEKDRLMGVVRSVWAGKWRAVKRPRAIWSSIQSEAETSQPVCIIDIGGQTTEMSLLVAGQVVMATVIEWGGMNVTELIQKQVWSLFKSAISWQTAEQLKREMVFLPGKKPVSSTRTTVRGKDIVRQVGMTTVIDAKLISPAVSALVDELIEEIKLFLSQAPSNLTGSLLDAGLWLCGGGSQLMGLDARLSEQLRYSVRLTPNPELDAIFGLRMLVQSVKQGELTGK
ncbi:MAG: rod shape-determining protein [Patescibacteria group bacterium]